MNNYDKILNSATDNYGGRECLERPFPCDKYIVATDGHILVRIEATKCEEYRDIKRKQDVRYPNTNNIFPTEDCDIILPLDKLVETIMSVPETETTKYEPHKCECDECEGRGEVQWEYEDSDGEIHVALRDCPICDGRGYILSEELPRSARYVAINDKIFVCGYLMDIAEAMNSLQKTEAHILHRGSDKAMLVRIEDGVDIILMPCMNGEPRATLTLN